jgi:thiosulfate/3-mercaptopyruvate sulfurtransferase
MALPQDSAPKFQEYAHPEMIVSTEWVAQHLDDPGLVVAESDEDVLLYETGHIPGAVKLDWHTELNDPVTRDYVDGAGFARLMSEKGISRDTTLVLYGDRNNWWAAYALWVCSLFGHPDVRLMDGGRAKWIAEGRPLSTDTPKPAPADYPDIARDDACARPASTAASCCTCPTTRRRARCAAATSRAPRASPGRGPRPRTPLSRRAPSSRPFTRARPG